MGRLTGKRVYATGGAGGIGRATAMRCIAEGATVYLSDVSGVVKGVAKELGAAGADITDASDAAAVRASVDEAARTLGGLDVLFLNAGTEGRIAPLQEVTEADFRRVLDINLFGVFHALQAGIPHLLSAGAGVVIMTSSVAGFIGSAGLGPYCVSKHALNGLMRTAAQELGPLGIRVNTVNPGPIDNRMMASIERMAAPGAEAAVREGFSARVPLRRYGRDEEVAAMVAFLASDDASYCNGHTYLVDGGMRSG